MMFASAPLALALNHLLANTEWARLRLRAFAGQSLRLEIGPLQSEWRVTERGEFTVQAASDSPAVHITLPTDAPLLLLFDAKRVMRQAKISGSVAFAETLNAVFRHLEWDAEADLSLLVGDIPAHRLVRAGQALRQRLRQAGENLAANLVEYARDEAELLASPAQLATFTRKAEALRAEVDELEKRLARLEKIRAGADGS
jgi:ubiquinone biosynthesis protein UbiJ